MSRQGIAFDYNSPAELYLSRPSRLLKKEVAVWLIE